MVTFSCDLYMFFGDVLVNFTSINIEMVQTGLELLRIPYYNLKNNFKLILLLRLIKREDISKHILYSDFLYIQ